MPDARPLRPDDPERIGGYRLLGVLGSGGQGVVYRGVGDSGREVAIKLLHSHLTQDATVTRGFLREVETARRVAAFCTAAVLDVGMLEERPYIVSEYVPGDTLQALVLSSGPRTGGALDRLAISTLTALAAIHQAGIVHRDFKPGNVLMGPDGPIVIDFGIAKALDATTRTSGVVGTPAYMSPEQFRGERVGPASDVFSWAGTMVFAATGRAPFGGGSMAVLLNRILSGLPDLDGVPGHLVGPIGSCLAKDPSLRPAPTDLLRALIRQGGPWNGGSPSDDAGPGAERTARRGRAVGRRALIGGGAAVAAVGVLAFVVRPGNGLFQPAEPTGGTSPRQPTGGTSPRQTTGGPTSPAPSPSPSGGNTAGEEPFGTPLTDPAELPGGGAGEPTAVAAAAGVVVCGTAKGVVFGWDTRAPVVRLGDGGGRVTSVAAGSLGGRQVAASGHGDGRMRLWGLDGQSVANHRAGDPIIAVTVASRAIAVSEKYDGMKDLHSVVRLWDVSTGKQVGAPVTEHFQGIRGLAFGRLGGDDVLVTGDGGERVRVWRLADGRQEHSFPTGEIGGIELLACGELKGKPVLVSTHLDATLRVYDLASGKRRKKWKFSDQSPDDRGATALAAGRLGDVPIAAVAHAPAGGQVIVRVWNLDDGEILGVLGPGEGGEIRTLALTERDGRTVVTGADEDGTLRIWSLGPT